LHFYGGNNEDWINVTVLEKLWSVYFKLRFCDKVFHPEYFGQNKKSQFFHFLAVIK
jgi:hypothetical protein